MNNGVVTLSDRVCAQTKRTAVDDARNNKTRETTSDERKFRCSFDEDSSYGKKRKRRNASIYVYSILDHAVTQS